MIIIKMIIIYFIQIRHTDGFSSCILVQVSPAEYTGNSLAGTSRSYHELPYMTLHDS